MFWQNFIGLVFFYFLIIKFIITPFNPSPNTKKNWVQSFSFNSPIPLILYETSCKLFWKYNKIMSKVFGLIFYLIEILSGSLQASRKVGVATLTVPYSTRLSSHISCTMLEE